MGGSVMRFVDEYRSAALAKIYTDRIRAVVTRPWTIMEICGGQTHTIVKLGIGELLPDQLTLVHGPAVPFA